MLSKALAKQIAINYAINAPLTPKEKAKFAEGTRRSPLRRRETLTFCSSCHYVLGSTNRLTPTSRLCTACAADLIVRDAIDRLTR